MPREIVRAKCAGKEPNTPEPEKFNPEKFYFIDFSGSSSDKDLRTIVQRLLKEGKRKNLAIYAFAEKVTQLTEEDLIAIAQLGSDALDTFRYFKYPVNYDKESTEESDRIGQQGTKIQPILAEIKKIVRNTNSVALKEVVILSDPCYR